MLRFVAILATLAVANGFSLYQLPECLNPIDLNICNQAPLCAPVSCAPAATQTVCLPAAVAGGVSGSNSNAIISLLGALKSAGVIPDPNAAPPRDDSILALKLLNLLSVIIGGSGGGGNGTVPILPGDASSNSLIVINLLNNLLGGGGGGGGGGASSPQPSPANFQTILLHILASMASNPSSGPCPCGTIPVTIPACPPPAPRCA